MYFVSFLPKTYRRQNVNTCEEESNFKVKNDTNNLIKQPESRRVKGRK